MDSETKELPHTPKIEDLSGGYVELANRDSVLVSAEALGVDQWREMIDATQKDFRERGLVVSRKRKGTLVRSKVFIGEGEDAEIEIRAPISHELKSLIPGRQNLVFIHTHAMTPKDDHLRTSSFSDDDIQKFLTSDYKALVMLCRGGAHFLVPTSGFPRAHQSLDKDLVMSVVENVKKNSGRTWDIVKGVSKKLAQRGFGYFYTPELDHTGKDSVRFYNPENFQA
ncbi:hypothetical protein A3G67_04745 [Candidatus Roizmanbacteria bacterium RIFCSPLOWO2_12_FULL_40_12]|uniref:Uncharacterized protein n=1 Tax=Candidatus Roizmanbacteria bacterium RIFCSPLOWO2_01_FULL_40_42 TaxID=1802066 RepID=A0A1F7J4L8_9BACT|nr:MAG: hypothetical protein A2779_04405 [Candidatus Roizmanbacteria bacterium RIFCSPHIGHO2_01_FULL_40_98]OGK27317.1 MAG: hypothetical protein A3C31_04730 [Candidatus Roizmanbacteria bacterium RIFCSPHIGHO2_02_FULL_40_53]OGK30811.1 MAG: hypothetical protein A2W49_02310 [Candidatus Roizmanbacteria bacterium RIFCSPHIGHO2_12_41_18]OGK36422.1 MAG: hypothetical protein A3E69_02355 [Candidatus Roizmanbacteria bacterium RIFCSPHIGHO2_12_FULL_40_130]OGK50550.1 MAG: hypothetical protein A3B50_02085 [Candi